MSLAMWFALGSNASLVVGVVTVRVVTLEQFSLKKWDQTTYKSVWSSLVSVPRFSPVSLVLGMS